MAPEHQDTLEEPLLSDDGFGESNETEFKERKRREIVFTRRRLSYTVFVAILVPWLVVLILSGYILRQYTKRGPSNPIFPQMLYSLSHIQLFSSAHHIR